MMRRAIGTAGAGLVLVLFAADLAWGVLNNGFHTEYVYAVRDDEHFGTLDMWGEDGNGYYGQLQGNSTNWKSLTFSGTGDNDARLFVAKSKDEGGDIRIRELDASGNTVDEKMLSGLVPGLAGASVGNIRYDGIHNSLMVTGDNSGTGTTWEIDLGLSQLLHTYVGPSSNASFVSGGFNDDTGMLYMTGTDLGGTQYLGNLVAFDTNGRMVGGTTTSYTTLIDGSEVWSWSGEPWMDSPWSPTYRGTNNPTGQPTVLLSLNSETGDHELPEFYLNQTDANGNLAMVGYRTMNIRAMGQLDKVNGIVWMGSPWGGLYGLHPDGTMTVWDNGGDVGYWMDAASPYSSAVIPPLIADVPDHDIEIGGEYVQQLVLAEGSPPATWTLLQGATGAVVDSSTGLVSGWTPGLSDIGTTVTFEAKVTTETGEDTEAWDITVLSPVIAEVTPDPKVVGSGGEYVEQLTIEHGTPPAPTWTLLQGPAGATVDNSGRVSGWMPGPSDIGATFTFEVKAAEGSWEDTESWQVKVRRGANGFCADCLYACQDYDAGGALAILLKDDGTTVGELQPGGSNWTSLTFAGRGKNNDARLFVAKLYPATGMSQPRGTIEVAELNASGEVAK